MSDVEIEHYLGLAIEELVAAQDNLRLDHFVNRLAQLLAQPGGNNEANDTVE